jgi:hypothetical protein
VSLLYSWEIIPWTEATRGRVGVCVVRLSRHLRYDLRDRSGNLFLKAIKGYIGSARCSSRNLTLINVAALSAVNTEARLSSTTTIAAECSVQAGRAAGLSNRPNGERGFVHFVKSRLYHTISWTVDLFRFLCDMGVFTGPCVLVTGILICCYCDSAYRMTPRFLFFNLPPTLDPTRSAVRTLELSPIKLCTPSTRKAYHLTTACFVFMTFDFYSYPKGSPSIV